MLRWCPDHVNARESSSHHRQLQASVAGTKATPFTGFRDFSSSGRRVNLRHRIGNRCRNAQKAKEETMTERNTMATQQPLTAVIVGTGFGGIGMAIKLRQAGITDFVML